MRGRHPGNPIVAAACVATLCVATAAGCGDDSSAECHSGGAGADGDAGDSGDSTGADGPGGPGDSGGVGQVLIEGSVTNCAAVSPISVSPDNGGMVILSATINDPPNNGAPPTFQWTAPGGTFADPRALSTTFTCGGAGTVIVTLTVSSPGCDQHSSGTVICN